VSLDKEVKRVKKGIIIAVSFIVLLVAAAGVFVYFRLWPGLKPAVGPIVKTSPPKDSPPKTVSAGVNETGLPLSVPDGFRMQMFARYLGHTRMLAFDPAGVLVATLTTDGKVVALPDMDGNGQADGVDVLVSGLDTPHGLAFHKGYLYIAENSRVTRYPYTPSAEGAPKLGQAEELASLPTGGGHTTRSIAFGPDGKMYVAAGSSSNIGVETDQRRAAVMRFNDDGSGGQIFATGLRNSVGLAIHPVTGELWGVDNGRDNLGDDLPPDEVNIIRESGFYGWPYAYADKVPDPEYDNQARAAASLSPVIQLQAHSAPLGLCFYSGNGFGPAYAGNLFVTFHGSWNRSQPTGYKVVRFTMSGDLFATPGPQEDFITGWLTPEGAVGRPVAIIQGGDGALYISDDKLGAVYRVSRL
jgi:glucose/arabinose dehydrogenase